MKNILMLALALLVVYFVWHLVMALLGTVISAIISIGAILLFCYAVYAVYRLLTRQKA